MRVPCQIRAKIQDHQWAATRSVLAQGFANPALGQLVLAYDALGIDPEEYVDAVPGPFGDLGWVDATVEPRGKARVPKVVGPPAEGRGLLRRGERGLASFDPCAPVSDRGQLAAPHTAKEAAVRRGAELREVIAQKPCQLRMDRARPGCRHLPGA